jgi:hypothetical protein
MTAWTGPAAKESCRIANQQQARLARSGTVCAKSGTLRWAEGTLALHTDFGPADQDKDTNQDYVVAWVPGSAAGKEPILWAMAMADGVTSSLYAEVGAELACWSALACLVSHGGDEKNKARAAIDAAGDAIGVVADTIAAAGEIYRPAAEFSSTWRYTLREGLLLQTTLTLAWLEHGVLNLAMIGDGGAAVEEFGETDRRIKVLAQPDPSTNRVHALGAHNRRVSELDGWQQTSAAPLRTVAFYTDGIARALDTRVGQLFESLQDARRKDGNSAESLIKTWLTTREAEFDDNLSLAVASWV